MDDLGFGLQVTVLGLGVVFGLLVLLWALLTVALRLDTRAPRASVAETAPDEPARTAPVAASSPVGNPDPARITVHPLDGDPSGLTPELVAAIAVAVARHAEQRRREAAPVMRAYWPGSLLFASRWVAAGRMRQGRTWQRRSR